MASHTFLGKRKLCYTEVSDFTDIQGIGRDPMYRRYDSVFSIVKKVIPVGLQHFLATPEYLEDEDKICWHIDKWNETPVHLSELTGAEYDRYKSVLDDTVRTYKNAVTKLSGVELQIMAGAIKYFDNDRVYCCDDKVYIVAWGMTPDLRRHKVVGSIIHDFEQTKKYKIIFDAGSHGSIDTIHRSINKMEGKKLTEADFPLVHVDEGWEFMGWAPSPEGIVVNANMSFTAQYTKQVEAPVEPIYNSPADDVEEPQPEEYHPKYYNCIFYAGDNGELDGIATVRKEEYSTLEREEIPNVIPHNGYRFKGWDVSPVGVCVDSDKVFVAQYEKLVPWYRRWWLWFLGLRWKWLLVNLLKLLLLVLLFWLLLWLFRSCIGCGGHSSVNGVVPMDTIVRGDGRVVDDNGFAQPLTGDDGRLPDDVERVAPVLGGGGEDAPIVERPGVPNTFANRLFLFIEDDNDDVESLAEDFKKAYPGDRYSIIGYDREVKLLVIQVPEQERETVRKTINAKIPNHRFLVFDEEVYEQNGQQSSASVNSGDRGWHIKAINLKAAWRITKGSPKVKVAVIDDGIDAAHPMFKGRIVDAYNVFTQSNKLSYGSGHGTHTAGLAAGSADYVGQGAAGVAPDCKLMPIQVFDNKLCPLSALIAGVMYAIHHDADVVNLSVSPSFRGLNALPEEQQKRIANTQFKNVERLWKRVCTIAAKKKCILVFAAGNDDILSSVPPENRNEAAIVVTAVDKTLTATDFTNYGPCSDISAPGKNIYSSIPRGKFCMYDGTSMAAPIVTGAIALMKSLKKDITVTQARNVLYKTGADVYGDVPPMLLVDKALAGVKKGDFSTPSKRPMKSSDKTSQKIEGQLGDRVQPSPAPESGKGESDYDAIRRQIAFYEKKIEELKKLLRK